MIEDSGLTWDVSESTWMPATIKLNGSLAKVEIAACVETLRNLADADVKTICYNFMPLLIGRGLIWITGSMDMAARCALI